MEANRNILIEASAGTGKTEALGKRLIELQRAGVEPQNIVALTFSRAAAGEIFERFVSLLVKEKTEHKAPDAVKLLRKVIATQHLSQIGTLDSFLMRIVRVIPLELGLMGELEMMDDYRQAAETDRLSASILRRTDKAAESAFVSAFMDAMKGDDVRNCVEGYRDLIREWHERVLMYPDASAWGDLGKIFSGKVPSEATATDEDVINAGERLRAVADGDKDLLACAEWVKGFRGKFTKSGLAGRFLELNHEKLFKGATIDVEFGRGKNRSRSYGGEQAKAIRDAVRVMCGWVVNKKARFARGVYRIVSEYEKAYAEKVRKAGHLVFSDVPRFIAAFPKDKRRDLEYRLDSQIQAWALDEFQDTSHEQWDAISSLIDDAQQSDGDKSVFIVGDCKQAIYGWRGGDVGIFKKEIKKLKKEIEKLKGNADDGKDARVEIRPLYKSHRSGQAVIDAVNKVFVDEKKERISARFPMWEAPKHEVAPPEEGESPKPVGFVQVKPADGSKKEDFVDPVCQAIKDVESARGKLSIAILVRSNGFGEFLASALKAEGIGNVVWEGESAIRDTPVLCAFLDLVQLADHPGDEQAYRHFVSTPLAKALYPEGVPGEADVSAAFARAFTARGLVRVFRECREKLPKDPEAAWNAFTESRFTDFLRAAAEFEAAREPGARLSDFALYLDAQKKRNIAEPGKIKVMTIHRSKGLSFDYVILPIYEWQNALTKRSDRPLLGNGWIFPDPGSEVMRFFDAFGGAGKGFCDVGAKQQANAEQEALCMYYVAMTRAKVAMTIVVPKEKEGGKGKAESEPVYFSSFVRAAIPEPIGDPKWHESFTPEKKDAAAEPARKPFTRPKRETFERRLPSVQGEEEFSAGSLFSNRNRRAALERGTALHEAYALVEWIDPAAPRTETERDILALGWEEAFVKRDPSDTVWRERSFELLADGRWTSGQFDRVVFTGSGPDRRATVYDFKTNAQGPDETPEAFAERLRGTYFGQLASYRAALASLTAIPPDRISLALLTSAGKVEF